VGALGSRAPSVRSALNQLYGDQRVQLFIAYVRGFSGRSPQDWVNATAAKNGLGRGDLLLAVATHDRQYAVSAAPDAGLTRAQLNEVSGAAIEPALRANDWAGAAIGAADGYDAVLTGRPVTPRASRTALMVASVPELTSRTCCTGPTRSMITSASSTSRSVGAPKDSPSSAAARTASTTAGCAWPRIIGPHEHTRST